MLRTLRSFIHSTLFIVFAAFSSLVAAEDTSPYQLSGKLMIDSLGVDGLHSDNIAHYDTLVRRARLKFSYSGFDRIQLKSQLANDHSSDDWELKTWQLTYQLSKNLEVIIGKHKEPLGLESATSSNYLATLERSMVTNAFSSKHSIGTSLSWQKKRFSIRAGIFDNTEEEDFSKTSLTTRLTRNNKFSVSEDLTLHWHLGVGAALREEDANNKVRINQSVESAIGESQIESRRLDATSQTVINIEAAANLGRLNWQFEWYQQDVNVSATSERLDSQYSGFYHQFSYVVLGKQLKYNKHRFSGISTDNQYGGLSVSVKYSELDARDHGTGSEANNTTFSANYYWQQFKVSMQYSVAKLTGKNSDYTPDGKQIGLRLQYAF